MPTCKITLPDSSHPVIISKNPKFRAPYLARQSEFRCFFLFNKYKKNIFFHFGCGLLPEKCSFCPKNNGFARVESGGLQWEDKELEYVDSPAYRQLYKSLTYLLFMVWCYWWPCAADDVILRDLLREGKQLEYVDSPAYRQLSHVIDTVDKCANIVRLYSADR